MDPRDIESFRETLRREIQTWPELVDVSADPWWGEIAELPRHLDRLASLYADADLPGRLRRIVGRVLKYLLSPLDLVPEYVHGVDGYREDLYLIVLLYGRLREEVAPEILESSGVAFESGRFEALRRHAERSLDEETVKHLHLLLEADAVAGDEDLEAGGGATEASEREEGRDPRPARHTIVFAGPGTGKTRRMEEAVLRLLLEEETPPEALLVTTFTRKAADELRVRVRDRLQARLGSTATADAWIQRLAISTIHSFCYDLIARFQHHLLFLKGTFQPLDETQRMLFLFRHGYGELGLRSLYRSWRREQREAGRKWGLDWFDFYAYVGDVYDFASEEVVTGQDPGLRHRYLQILHAEEPGAVDEAIVRSYPRYWRLMQESGYLDHAMVLAYTEALLHDPHVRRRVRRRLRRILVDEYQDTNPIQDRIFRTLAGETGVVFAVADDDQSIYGFRGADAANATHFAERYPGAEQQTRTENHRSTKALVRASQQLIARNRLRHPKEITTSNPEGVAPARVEAPRKRLPAATARALRELADRGVLGRWDEAALLFRGLTRRTREYKLALEREGIPYRVVGDKHFLKDPAVRGVVGVLEMVGGEAEKITARKRKFRGFFRALGRDPKAERDAILERIRAWNERFHGGEFSSILDLYYTILAETGAVSHDELFPELGHLSGLIADAEAELRSPELEKRLGYFLRFLESAAGGLQGPGGGDEDAVQVMTMHKAKGLEFRAVVLGEAAEGSVPADFPPDMGTRLRDELVGRGERRDPLEEERRVLYVAMTRAESFLLLATPEEGPSPFLEELDSEPFDASWLERAEAHTRARGGAPAAQPRRTAILHAPHSHVYNYRFCPKRYLLENRYAFAGRTSASLRAGLSLHRALEVLHRLEAAGEPVPPDRRERIFERCWVPPRNRPADEARSERDRLYRTFRRYAERLESGELSRRIRDLERPFYASQPEGVLTGKLDLVREAEDGRPEIVEFKLRENPMMPADYTREQLECYSLAFPDARPRLKVYFLEKGEERPVEPTPEPDAVRERLAGVFERIQRGEFPPDPDARKCRVCPVRNACADRAA